MAIEFQEAKYSGKILPVPMLGQYADEILKQICGLCDSEEAEMKEQGAFTNPPKQPK